VFRRCHSSSSSIQVDMDSKEDRVYLNNQLNKGKEPRLRNLGMDLPRDLPRLSVRMVLVPRTVRVRVVFRRLCKVSSRRYLTLSLKVDLGGSTRSMLVVDVGVRPILVLVLIWTRIKV
jgi:hypothetical protein